MSAYSNPANELNSILSAITAGKGVKYVSAHTASPGTTGASEVPAGVYARQATAWGPLAGPTRTA